MNGNNHGGAREGAGRPKKMDEDKMLSMMDAVFAPEEYWQMLGERCKGDNPDPSLKLWGAYRFGLPTAKHEITGEGGAPIIINVIPDE